MYVLPSQRSTPNRTKLIATYTAKGWVVLEITKIRSDIWIRFQCGGLAR